MILFQMEEVWVSFGITDNIHLKGHAYLISSHDGKAQRGQDILDQKGGKLAEDFKKTTSKSLLLGPLCQGEQENKIMGTENGSANSRALKKKRYGT